MTDDDTETVLAAAEAHVRRLTHHWNHGANADLRALALVLDEYDRRGTELTRRAAIVAAAIEFRRESRFTSREARTPQAAVIRAVDTYFEAAREATR